MNFFKGLVNVIKDSAVKYAKKRALNKVTSLALKGNVPLSAISEAYNVYTAVRDARK